MPENRLVTRSGMTKMPSQIPMATNTSATKSRIRAPLIFYSNGGRGFAPKVASDSKAVRLNQKSLRCKMPLQQQGRALADFPAPLLTGRGLATPRPVLCYEDSSCWRVHRLVGKSENAKQPLGNRIGQEEDKVDERQVNDHQQNHGLYLFPS
jgi:hypothetical protein